MTFFMGFLRCAFSLTITFISNAIGTISGSKTQSILKNLAVRGFLRRPGYSKTGVCGEICILIEQT